MDHRQFLPVFTAQFTEDEAVSLCLALKASLDVYRTQGFDVDGAPKGCTIGDQRELLKGLEAIRLGNRRGTKKYDIVMVAKDAITKHPATEGDRY